MPSPELRWVLDNMYSRPRTIVTRTPFRVSFAGGGTDLPEYYKAEGWGAVCSMAINRYMYVMAKPLPPEFPYRYKLAYSKTELCQAPLQIEHPLLKEAVWTSGLQNLDFSSQADIPAGTGMGSSSAFAVGALHALALIKGNTTSSRGLAEDACKLEIERLGGSLGKQDQYASAFGGLNYIKFVADESVEVSSIHLTPTKEDLFCSHLRLYYIGSNRSAESILKGQIKRGSVLDRMRWQAKECADLFHYNGHPKDLGKLLEQAWALKKSLSADISTTEIDEVYAKAAEAGIYGGKLLGAGGAGYLLVCCPPDLELNLGLQRIDFRPDYSGSKAFTI